MKWVDQMQVKNRRVFLRVDFNVPIQDGSVQDSTRIHGSLPTIRWILDQGGIAILASHLGRPEGRFNSEYSLKPVARELEKTLASKVIFTSDCIGPAVEETIGRMEGGDCVCLENLRFHPGEETNDSEFSKALARLADVYINDAFGAAHRAHASTSGITRHIKEKAGGFLLRKEIEAMTEVLFSPERPLLAVLGGAKVSDKIEVLENLSARADRMLIGGGMALTLLHALGLPVGRSRVEHDKMPIAHRFLKRIEGQKISSLILPKDHLVVHDLSRKEETGVVAVDEVPPDLIAVDIGPTTIQAFEKEIRNAKTIIWNGPMGIFEVEEFSRGTMAIARAVAHSQGMTLVGGGDSVSALAKSGCMHLVQHVSTGGGATLEFLAGRRLPGIESLRL
jgi:phosphoglycerate kinase